MTLIMGLGKIVCDEFTDITSRVQSGTLNGNLMYSCGVTVRDRLTAEFHSSASACSSYIGSRLTLTVPASVPAVRSARLLSQHMPAEMGVPVGGFSVLATPGGMGLLDGSTTIITAFGNGDNSKGL
jgi:hypothetical protein